MLLVLDRRDDPVTPLLSQWTYQARGRAPWVQRWWGVSVPRTTQRCRSAAVKGGGPRAWKRGMGCGQAWEGRLPALRGATACSPSPVQAMVHELLGITLNRVDLHQAGWGCWESLLGWLGGVRVACSQAPACASPCCAGGVAHAGTCGHGGPLLPRGGPARLGPRPHAVHAMPPALPMLPMLRRCRASSPSLQRRCCRRTRTPSSRPTCAAGRLGEPRVPPVLLHALPGGRAAARPPSCGLRTANAVALA